MILNLNPTELKVLRIACEGARDSNSNAYVSSKCGVAVLASLIAKIDKAASPAKVRS